MGKSEKGCCVPKLTLKQRPLLTSTLLGGLRELYKILSNDTRLKILHALVRSEELRVNELSTAIGMKPQAVSNQLQRLSGMGILACRREGSSILYRIADPCVTTLLDTSVCLIEDSEILGYLGRKTA